MTDSLVLLPTYNEKDNIEKIIRHILSLNPRFDILVIDDGSPDGTADIVKTLQKEFTQNLFLETRTGKLGLGTAYIMGFKWALERKYEYVFEIDADFSHNPDDLIRLKEACSREGADASIGSRYTKGGKVKNWPIGRILISYYASVYVRLVTWMPVKDPTAGFVCYTRKAISSINLDHIKFTGYAFQIEMKFALWKLGFKIKEVPITFVDREFGVSKMSSAIFSEAFLGVIKLQMRYLTGQAKKIYKK